MDDMRLRMAVRDSLERYSSKNSFKEVRAEAWYSLGMRNYTQWDDLKMLWAVLEWQQEWLYALRKNHSALNEAFDRSHGKCWME